MKSISLTTPQTSEHRQLKNWIHSPILWGLFLAFGLAIRLRQYLFAASYWYDEAFLVLAIRERSFAQLLGPQPYNLVIPPVFLWITRGLYEFGGEGELLMRLPAFVAGVVALLLMIPLARRTTGGPHAFWAFALLAASRRAVSHGSEVRPYTLDLLSAELILLCTVMLIDASAKGRRSQWAIAGLGTIAAVAPWLSFPSSFMLAGTSAALAVYAWHHPNRWLWIGWSALSGVTFSSGLLLWWSSGRYLYYEGMIEHWGHKGWRGFPDWQSPIAVAQWLVTRPYEVANYGNRDLGIILALLAITGSVSLAKRSRALAVLLVTPFLFAIVAALLGRYPLANRTTFFLTPSLWLLVASGLGALVQWGGRHGPRLMVVGLLLVGWSSASVGTYLVRPDAGLDYRGAYEFIHARRKAGDAIWSQTAVVYQTYYGKNAPVLKDEEFTNAEQQVSLGRLWVVMGSNRNDLRQRLESAGGLVTLDHRVSGLQVLLFEPRMPPEGK